jgi:Holliday junction resolvase RusA-like endonuclease
MTVNLTFLGQPISKKNSSQIITNRRTGSPMIIPSKAYRDYERRVKASLGIEDLPQFTGPVNMRCLYHLKDNCRPDLLNLLAATSDILEALGVVVNDRQVEAVDGSRIAGVSPHNPRVEITLTRLDTGGLFE